MSYAGGSSLNMRNCFIPHTRTCHRWLLASFHGDSNGLSTQPVVSCLHDAAQSLFRSLVNIYICVHHCIDTPVFRCIASLLKNISGCSFAWWAAGRGRMGRCSETCCPLPPPTPPPPALPLPPSLYPLPSSSLPPPYISWPHPSFTPLSYPQKFRFPPPAPLSSLLPSRILPPYPPHVSTP